VAASAVLEVISGSALAGRRREAWPGLSSCHRSSCNRRVSSESRLALPAPRGTRTAPTPPVSVSLYRDQWIARRLVISTGDYQMRHDAARLSRLPLATTDRITERRRRARFSVNIFVAFQTRTMLRYACRSKSSAACMHGCECPQLPTDDVVITPPCRRHLFRLHDSLGRRAVAPVFNGILFIIIIIRFHSLFTRR